MCSADDLLTFAAANAGMIDTPLKNAMERMRAFRRPTATPGMRQAMGWLTLNTGAFEMFLHDGGTHGFRSAIVVDPASKRAAVAWTNAPLDVTDLAGHLVAQQTPLRMLGPTRVTVHLDEEMLASYVGTYQLAPAVSFEITRDGDRMFAQLTGQSRLEIFAEKKDEFFLRIVPAQISFSRDASGNVDALVLHQNGVDRSAARVK